MVRVLNRYLCEKFGISEAKRRFTLGKSTIVVKIEEPISKPGPIGRMSPSMRLANAPMAPAVFSWSVRFLRKSKRI